MPVLLRWFLNLAITNPISVRLVQNGSRRTRHLYIRAGYLAVLIVVLLWSLIFTTQGGTLSYRALAAAGAESFIYVAYLQIALICVLAPVFMAGAIAQEANPQTWDILLTTPLSAIQIVLGNLFGRLFFILALLFASLPLFALTQYFGGVPGRSIFTSYLIAGCAALLVGTIAIALSVSRLVGKRAVFAFYVAVVSYLAVTAGLDYWVRAAGNGVGGNGVTWFTAINPFLALHSLLNPTTYPRADAAATTGLASWFLARPVAAWCVGSALLSTGLMLVSTLTVRLGGIAGAGGVGGRGGVPWYRRMFGLGAAGAEHRPPRAVWTNPVAWREAAARNATLGRLLARWAFIALGGAFGLLLVVLFHVGRLDLPSFQLAVLATVWAELAVATLVAINMSATAVSREREDGTLDLLLTTPITPAQYLSGKLRGLVAYLLPLLAVPIGTLLVAGVYVLTDGFGKGGLSATATIAGGMRVTYPAILPEAALVATLTIVPFIAACAMIGLLWSVKSKGTLSSVVATVGVVGVIAGIIGLCGWKSGAEIPLVGPILSALSPGSLVYAMVHIPDATSGTIEQGGGDITVARITLLVGSAVAALLYAGIVYGIHASLVRVVGPGGLTNFDITVRKLAGMK